MANVKAVGRLEDGYVVRVQAGDHEYVLDERVGRGGSGQGALPGEVLLAALIGCQAMVARVYLRRQRIREAEVTLESELREIRDEAADAEPESAFVTVIKIETEPPLTDEQLAEAAELIEERCPIGNLLRQQNLVHLQVARG